MSDKRATYVLGAVAVSLALVLGLITAVPAITTVSITSSPMDIMGHAIVVLRDTDGNIKAYQQTDNIVPHNGKDCAASLIFGSTTADFCDDDENIFSLIDIGSSTIDPALTDTGLILPVTGITRTGTLIGGSAAVGDTGSIKIIEGTFTLLTDTDVAEVGLFDGPDDGDDMISRFELTTPISAGLDDTVTITYVFEVG